MSLAGRLRVLLVCVALEAGVLSGVPMRPDEIQELMRQMNRPALAHVLPTDDEGGDAREPGVNCDEQAVQKWSVR